MTNLTVSYERHTIEMSKTFAKAASKFGSEEYKMLQEARRDNPDYRVEIITTKRKSVTAKNTMKGLTYAYMESYIKAHDDENKTIMKEYNKNRGLSEDVTECTDPYTYLEMKAWFLKQFPAIAAFNKTREELLNRKAG